MKNRFLKLLFVFIAIPFLSFSQDYIEFKAAGVTCSMCSRAIEKSLKTEKNIQKIEPDLDTQTWKLNWKTGTFKLEKLKQLVEDAGFSLAEVKLNTEVIYTQKINKRNKKSK